MKRSAESAYLTPPSSPKRVRFTPLAMPIRSRSYSSRRRYGAKRRVIRRKRSVRRRTVRRRRLTRRSILNISSRKKSDTMLTTVPTGATPTPTAVGDWPIYPPTAENGGGTVSTTLFCPTARSIDSDGIYKDEPSARTQSNTYARGYKEVTTIRCVGQSAYRLRRICFSMKGLPYELLTANAGNVIGYYTNYDASGGGYTRQTAQTPVSMTNNVYAIIFRGNQGNDWFSPFNATIDTTRIRLHSDRTYNFNPGNQAGMTRVLKNWYPLNKALQYDDDEAGVSDIPASFSSQAKFGMGDFFIFDIYQATGWDPNAGSTNGAGMFVNHEGRYYWHER